MFGPRPTLTSRNVLGKSRIIIFMREPEKKPSKTAWFNAVRSWDYRLVKDALREAPELLAATNAKGLNALHVACAVRPGKPGLQEENGIKTVSALLDAGIDIESVAFSDNDGGEWRANAVWFAVGTGRNLSLLRFLLKRGGDPSYSLFAVLWGYNPAFARELVKYKPRMDLRGGDGRTVLHAAANPNRLEVLELYLDAGADPWVKDRQGITPLDLAKKRRVPKQFIERMERDAPALEGRQTGLRPASDGGQPPLLSPNASVRRRRGPTRGSVAGHTQAEELPTPAVALPD